MCGEKQCTTCGGWFLRGSPPRVRGKGPVAAVVLSHEGITPACAGKRQRHFGNSGQKRDHPRVCGEKSHRLSSVLTAPGSPPRVRGKACHCSVLIPVKGITPECAGKSLRGMIRPRLEWDHPRVCGEKDAIQKQTLQDQGSPPRVRGKACTRLVLLCYMGITPACAGKSTPFVVILLCIRDHPRVCGEKHTQNTDTNQTEGSPPRVRGKARLVLLCCMAPGITPACAGKSYSFLRMAVVVRDHPRVCGEKAISVTPFTENSGSPPRVRGKDARGGTRYREIRITPACAGKSSCIALAVLVAWDHPRVCGEKPLDQFPALLWLGSPPRVRGKD